MWSDGSRSSEPHKRSRHSAHTVTSLNITVDAMGRGKKLITLLGQRLSQQFGVSATRSGEQQIASQQQPAVSLQQRAAVAQAAVAPQLKQTAQHQHQRVVVVPVPSSPSLLHRTVPAVTTDLYGAISAVTEGSHVEEGVFKNVDGHRFEDGRYKAFIQVRSPSLPLALIPHGLSVVTVLSDAPQSMRHPHSIRKGLRAKTDRRAQVLTTVGGPHFMPRRQGNLVFHMPFIPRESEAATFAHDPASPRPHPVCRR